MLYQAYQAHADLMAPIRMAARVAHEWMSDTPFVNNLLGRGWSASFEMLARSGMSHARPPFGITELRVGEQDVAIVEEVTSSTPFCDLLHFRKDSATPQPKVLLVAPMSGHFATLLRGTARTLLIDHDVYITDWKNARAVPLDAGRFDFDDFVDHVAGFLRVLGPGTHVVAVCQPSVPVLVAVSLMAVEDDACQPASMTLMGGPIDGRRNPTEVNKLAESKPYEWFEHNVIGVVPGRYPGAHRNVYPGFMQLAGFLAMNLDRHVDAHVKMFNNLVKGDGESAEATRKFYDEYMAVMDLPAEFYLQTIRQVFQNYELPDGKMVSRDRKVEPAAIRRTALLTVEGERDDICGLGQTQAAQDVASSLPPAMRGHYVQPGVGHYGVFNGKKWERQIYPVVRDFIAVHARG